MFTSSLLEEWEKKRILLTYCVLYIPQCDVKDDSQGEFSSHNCVGPTKLQKRLVSISKHVHRSRGIQSNNPRVAPSSQHTHTHHHRRRLLLHHQRHNSSSNNNKNYNNNNTPYTQRPPPLLVYVTHRTQYQQYINKVPNNKNLQNWDFSFFFFFVGYVTPRRVSPQNRIVSSTVVVVVFSAEIMRWCYYYYVMTTITEVT